MVPRFLIFCSLSISVVLAGRCLKGIYFVPHPLRSCWRGTRARLGVGRRATARLARTLAMPLIGRGVGLARPRAGRVERRAFAPLGGLAGEAVVAGRRGRAVGETHQVFLGLWFRRLRAGLV